MPLPLSRPPAPYSGSHEDLVSVSLVTHRRLFPPSFFWCRLLSLGKEPQEKDLKASLSALPSNPSGVLLDTIASCHFRESPSFHFKFTLPLVFAKAP
ncbi:hypothetical protein VYU27_001216 [Nannochloropsis oceanica]